MKAILNPIWIFVVNTLPQAILIWLYYYVFQIVIGSVAAKEKIILLEKWQSFGIIALILLLLSLLYGIGSIIYKKKINLIYSIASLFIYVGFLYIFFYDIEILIPREVPLWMLADNTQLYLLIFTMPLLVYHILCIVVILTNEEKKNSAWMNFGGILVVPIGIYLLIQVIVPFMNVIGRDSSRDIIYQHILIIAIVIGTILFLFFVLRWLYILALQKLDPQNNISELIWLIAVLLFGIPFPLLGLAINNGNINASIFSFGKFIFGDFSNKWFYILAFINGILISVPYLKHKFLRLALFIGRAITFTYTLYFFLIFLPYLPLSVLAIILIGIGFLMLTPLVLMFLHVKILRDDFLYLQQYFSKLSLIGIFLGAMLVIPASITVNYMSDRIEFHKTLAFIWENSYTNPLPTPNTKSLKNILEKIENNKESRDRDFSMNKNTPFLSTYYNWLVLDNLTLSQTKIDKIKHVFAIFESPIVEQTIPSTPWQENEPLITDVSNNATSKTVAISHIATKSHFQKEGNFWKTWIDLEITNHDTINRQQEYTTAFSLPVGVWLSDYYLWIGNEKVFGLLAEKKAATWIYRQIVNTRRDPGILFYNNAGNQINFQVFPFLAKETRKTGFEVIHKEPITLEIDGHKIALGDSSQSLNISEKVTHTPDKQVTYISPAMKANLPSIQRQPYYHFIIDGSVRSKNKVNGYTKRIKSLLNKNILPNQNTKFTWANASTNTFAYKNDWETQIKNYPCEKGFFLEKAMKEILVQNYISKEKSYPVIVVVTNNWYKTVLPPNFSDFSATFPENDLFFELDSTSNLIHHSFHAPHFKVDKAANFYTKTLAWPSAQQPEAFLPNDGQGSIVTKNGANFSTNAIKEKDWLTGLYLQGLWQHQILHPEKAEQYWLDLLKGSFGARIMTPVTSFISLENEAQRLTLKKKQEQVMAGKSYLDLGEENRMSEPSFVWILVIFVGIMLLIHLKKYFC